MSAHTSAAMPRALGLWLAAAVATAGTALLARTALDTLHRGAGFDEVLVAGCAVLATAGCAILLAGTTSVLAALRTGRLPGRLGPLRRAILTACGVAALTAAPAGAHAAPAGPGPHHGPALAGLPLPDRPSGGLRRAEAPAARVVRAGDSLWSIAAGQLGPGAPAREVAAYSARLYARNAATIGPDPDRILPGQRLELPPTTLDR